ncbi:hypothetical protein ACFVYA_31925 [Amycolatopsis sp. NPDC058278]|uniref:hypothetical protein n=1 Tax=Amycolatopsis sp. NPDC058278 TaxID=3346417 RepID=UPI0036DDD22D
MTHTHDDPIVAEIQKRVNRERYEALQDKVLSVVPDKARAELLAIMGSPCWSASSSGPPRSAAP